MATVRYLQECGAARTAGWTELLPQPPADTPTLSQTVLVNLDDADTAPMRSGDVDVEELRQGAPLRRRKVQAVQEAMEAASRASHSSEDEAAVEATTGKQQWGSSEESTSSTDQIGGLATVHAGDQGKKRQNTDEARGAASSNGDDTPHHGSGAQDAEDTEYSEVTGHSEGDQASPEQGDFEDQAWSMDEAGNLGDFDMSPEPPAIDVRASELGPAQQPTVSGRAAPTVPGLRIRQLSPTVPTVHPPGQSIWFLQPQAIRAQITRHPQPGELVTTALGLRGWIPGRPIGGTNTLFAALIGSWSDPRRQIEAPHEMLAQAIEYLDANAGEACIGLGQWMMSPETMIQHFNMGYNYSDIMEEPRLLIRDEEAARMTWEPTR